MTDPTDKKLSELDFKDPFYVISHDTSEFWEISGLLLKIFKERTKLYRDLALEGSESRFRSLLHNYYDLLEDKDSFDELLDKEIPDVVVQEFPYINYQDNKKWQKYVEWEDKLTLPITISFHPNMAILEIYDDITA